MKSMLKNSKKLYKVYRNKNCLEQSIAIYSAKYPIPIPYICLRKNSFIQKEFLSNDKLGSSKTGANAPGTTVAIQTVVAKQLKKYFLVIKLLHTPIEYCLDLIKTELNKVEIPFSKSLN